MQEFQIFKPLLIIINLLSQKISLANAAKSPATVQLILLYAPAEGRPVVEALLDELNISSSDWHLMPMLSSSSNSDLQSSNLGIKLTDALIRARQLQVEQQQLSPQQQEHQNAGPVVFLGMDSPETPFDEIAAVFAPNASNDDDEESSSASVSSLLTAVLCPAEDGGYGMLSVPPHLPANQVFANVRWSQSLTAISQLKALTDIIANDDHGNIKTVVRIGRLMHDIDEPADVHALVQRLQSKYRAANNDDNDDDYPLHYQHHHYDNLLRSSATPGDERTSDCPRTRRILVEYGFME